MAKGLFLFPMIMFSLFSVCTPSLDKPESTSELKSEIKLPKGFKIEVYAENVKNARSLNLGDKNTLFVGTRKEGKVYAIKDTNNDNKGDKIYTIDQNLNMPNGVAFKNGSLYVAEVNRILKYENIEENLENPPEPIVINNSLPDDTHHGWKFIAFGPDDLLYVPVGAPCNICNPDNEKYASILRMKPDGSDLEVFAHGIRNTVGFSWHPKTKELWFTDNGRDWLGDDLPPDELNNAPRKGMHFGYPYCHGTDIKDPDFGNLRSCKEFQKPIVTLGPHVAALGMRFYTGNMFPEMYKNNIFIAEHGSWNRSNPIGYRITMINFNSGIPKYEVFADGWLKSKNSVLGRPVDVLVMPDGALLVSDDSSDTIYRISYGK